MRTLKFLLRKEFRQIFRNKSILAVIFVAPMMQLLILPLAANYEIKNIRLIVVDHDHSSWSEQLTEKITASGYFQLTANTVSYNDAFKLIEKDEADLLLQIPVGFERNMVREGSQKIYIAMNAINGMKAGVGGGYLNSIIASFNNDIVTELIPMEVNKQLETVPLQWFNPDVNYKLFLIPGILALLVTIVGGFLTALNIVKEKEAGTIEQINVSPVKKAHFILGKLIPFWILANVVFTLGLTIAHFVYGIPVRGSLGLMYLFTGIYLFAILGFGLLVSTYCETQQQAMFIMFFFIMIFVLLGGLFTPVESMPVWAQWITRLNPVAYMIQVVRMVMLKGSGFQHILPQLTAVFIMAIGLNGWAIYNYRKSNR